MDSWSKCFDELKTWKHFKKVFWRSVIRSFNPLKFKFLKGSLVSFNSTFLPNFILLFIRAKRICMLRVWMKISSLSFFPLLCLDDNYLEVRKKSKDKKNRWRNDKRVIWIEAVIESAQISENGLRTEWEQNLFVQQNKFHLSLFSNQHKVNFSLS